MPVIPTETTGEDLGNLRRIVAATVFRIIKIVLLPIGAVSYVVGVAKLVGTAARRAHRQRRTPLSIRGTCRYRFDGDLVSLKPADGTNREILWQSIRSAGRFRLQAGTPL